MKLKIDADRKYVLGAIQEIVDERGRKDRASAYDSVLGDAISELIKLEMRECASADDPGGLYSGETLLHRAIDRVQAKLRGATPNFEFAEYVSAAERQLRGPAMELAELQGKLRESKELASVGDETIVDGLQPYRVKELGLKGAIEGVLTYPLGDVVEIDLDRLRQTYSVEGEWFPFQVMSNDCTFILDDDGSLFISTKYLSDVMMKEAKLMLGQIAKVLYSQ